MERGYLFARYSYHCLAKLTLLDLVSINTNAADVEELKVQLGLEKAWKEHCPYPTQSHVCASIEDAISLVYNLHLDKVQIFVTGSLHLIGGLLVVLDQRTASC